MGTEQNLPIVTAGGGRIYGSGFPSDIWKRTMDGALAGTPAEKIGTPAAASAPLIPSGPEPEPQPSRNPYDILNPPPRTEPRQQPYIVIPPASEPYAPEPVPETGPRLPTVPPQQVVPPVPPLPPPPRVVEILPGVTVPIP